MFLGYDPRSMLKLKSLTPSSGSPDVERVWSKGVAVEEVPLAVLGAHTEPVYTPQRQLMPASLFVLQKIFTDIRLTYDSILVSFALACDEQRARATTKYRWHRTYSSTET